MKERLRIIRTLLKEYEFFEIILRACNYSLPHKLAYFGKSALVSFNGGKLETRRMLRHAKIRRGTINDLSLLLDCSGSSQDELMAALFREFFEEGNLCYLVEYKDQIAGYAWAFLNEYILTYDDYKRSKISLCFSKDSVFFGNLFFKPEFRLRGFFPALFSAMIDELNKKHMKTIFFGNIESFNEHSLKSHIRLGFSKSKTFYYIYILGGKLLIVTDSKFRFKIYRLNGKERVCVQ